jgi:hypothetical protein
MNADDRQIDHTPHGGHGERWLAGFARLIARQAEGLGWPCRFAFSVSVCASIHLNAAQHLFSPSIENCSLHLPGSHLSTTPIGTSAHFGSHKLHGTLVHINSFVIPALSRSQLLRPQHIDIAQETLEQLPPFRPNPLLQLSL